MVVITFVYVVATIEICRANINAAEASKKQLEESKRQYEDKKRLEIIPYIQFEKTNGSVDHELKLVLESGNNLTGKYILVMCMKNIGNGTSKDISYTYQWENCTKSSDRGAFPVQALSSGESQTIRVDLSYATEKKDERKVCFHIRYRDLLENAYSQQLNLKFKYNENSKLSFRFYGNYIEADQGKVEFGNLFVIQADYYYGYEYPALAFDDLNKLITNDEYTNLLLEPPEKNPSSRHYFDLINWNGLEDNEFIIPHGLEITGDISAEESVNLLMGFGHTGIDELDYHKESLNINENTRNFKFGGKFKTLGLNFPDITSLLKDMVFFMQIDDSFDNQTPVNV